MIGSPDHRWPLGRVLFALAGTMPLLSATLAAVISPWLARLAALVGVNRWLYVVAHGCPASLVLRRVCGPRSAVYPHVDLQPARTEVTV